MKPKRSNPLFARFFAAGVTSIVLCSSSAFAATYQWDQNDSAPGLGGTGTWDTTNAFWDLVGTGADDGTDATVAVANWNPTTAADSAILGGTSGTVTLGSAVNVLGTTFSATGYNLDLTNTAATTYKLGALSGDATINVTLGTGTTTADFVATDWSGFTGTLNLGVAQAVASGKAAIGAASGNGLSSAAAMNITANSTLYSSTLTTHAAALTLNGGDTGETLGQLRLDNGGTWSGPITLAGAITTTNDSFIGTNAGTSFITGVISETGGAQTLSKGGSQTTVLSGANTYSGGTILRAGTLAVTSIGNVADTSGPLGTAAVVTSAANATLAYWGTGETTDRVVNFSTGNGGNISKDGTGTLIFSSAMTGTAAAMGVTLTGGGLGEMNGITNTTTLLNFNKTGVGKWTVNGNLTLNGGNIRPQGGILAFSATGATTDSAIISGRSNGGVIRFASGSGVVTSTANTNGILAGWATFGGNTWAVTNGASPITGLASFTTDTWAAGNNTDVTVAGPNPATDSTTNSLRFNDAGAKTLTLAGTNTVTSGGLMLTSTVGANNTVITGGTLIGANTADLVVHQNNTGGSLTISSLIANNTGATGLTKTGAGTLTLTSANTYTGTTYVDEGKLQVNATSGNKNYSVSGAGTLEINHNSANSGITVYGNGAASTNGVYFKTGITHKDGNTLNLQGAPTTVRTVGAGVATLSGWDTNATHLTVAAAASGSVFDSSINLIPSTYGYVLNIANGTNTATGDMTIGGLFGNGSGVYRKKSAGSLLITGQSTTQTSPWQIWEGSLILGGGANRIGTGAAVVLGNGSTSGKLVLNGNNQTLANLSMSGTGTANKVVNGSVTAATLTVNNAVSGTLGATIGGSGTNENNLSFAKTGIGTYTLTGNNTYTGATTVNGGTLQLDYSATDGSKLPNASTLDLVSGTLDLAGGTHTELVAATTLTGTGLVNITRSSGAAVIALGNITRTSTGTLNIAANGIATTSLANDGSGRLPSWISVNGQTAANDGSGNIITYIPTYTDVNRLGGQITSNSFSDVRIVDGGMSGNVTPLTSGLTEIYSLLQSATAGPAVIALGASDTLRLAPLGAVNVPSGSGSLTIQGGSLTAGGADDTNGVINFAADVAATVSSSIPDNGTGVVSLMKTGTGSLKLSASNAFTGGLILNQGALLIDHAEAMGIGGTLTINGGSLDNTSGAAISILDTIPQVWNADVVFAGSNDLTFTLGAVTLGANRTVTVNSGLLGIGGAVNGAFSLTKAGNGTLVLGGGNWSGATSVNAGTLEVQAKSGNVTYAIAQGATLKIGYNTGGAYTPGITLNGNGVADPAGLYLKGGVTVQTNGGLLIQTAPTTIRTYGTGNAATQGFDANAGFHIKTTTDASGSIMNPDINVNAGSYGYKIVTDSGVNNSTGDLSIQGVISGGGASQVSGEVIATGLHKWGAGSLNLTNASTYGSGTSINAGSIILSGGNDRLPVTTTVALGNGTGSGRLVLGGIAQTIGDILANGTGTDNRVVGNSVTASTLTVNYGGAGRTFGGFIGGGGTNENNLALVKSGSGTLTLSAVNTYSGDTTVTAGTLSLGQINANNESSTVNIALGATLDLAYAGTDTVDKLFIDGVPQPAGDYTAGGVFTGGGTLHVNSGPAGGYTSWVNGFTWPLGADKTRTGDPDGDGFTNLQEFLFGTSPVAGNGSLATTSSSAGILTIRWKQRVTGSTYRLMESATLANPWTLSGATPSNDGAAVGDYQPRKAAVTIGAGKDFFRIEGVEN